MASGLVWQGVDRHKRQVYKFVVDRDPLQVIFDATRARHFMADLEKKAVAAAVESGYTWAEIGEVFGISAQGAHARYAASVKAKK